MLLQCDTMTHAHTISEGDMEKCHDIARCVIHHDTYDIHLLQRINNTQTPFIYNGIPTAVIQMSKLSKHSSGLFVMLS